MFRCLLWVIAAAVRPKVLLIADNLCLRQQLLVLQRRKPRPRLKDADGRFWSGVSLVRWLANLSAHCETPNGAALAPSRVADLLVSAFKTQR
jgi:hypothetical protein